MVVNSPREFPLTRENVILIRQSHHFQISNLLPQIFCHLIIARPGNENLVALQPTVSGIFETLKLFIFFSGDLRGSIGDFCLSWRPSLFVSRGARNAIPCFQNVSFLSGEGIEQLWWLHERKVRLKLRNQGVFFFADVCLSARTTLLHNRTTPAVCPGENRVFQNMCQCSI